jgi:fumarate hydratase subunit beta
MAQYEVTPPLDESFVRQLKAGDAVLITGVIYTARDAAHRRLVELLEQDRPLPIDLSGQVIYYVGPTPPKPGKAAGSAGPTTSVRMDAYTPQLLAAGLKAMIGKGKRAPAVVEAMKKHGAVYLGAVGGAAALISRRIQKVEIVAYEDLGTEAIHKFFVDKFPTIVLIDSTGVNLYETEPPKYASGGAPANDPASPGAC